MIAASARGAMRVSRLLAAMLPMRGHIRTGFVEVDVLIDMVDPRNRNEVVVLTVGRALLGQLDLVGSLHMVDLSDRLLVRRDDVHVFLDLCANSHVSYPQSGWGYETHRCENGCQSVFEPKWAPVRMKKTRQNKNREFRF